MDRFVFQHNFPYLLVFRSPCGFPTSFQLMGIYICIRILFAEARDILRDFREENVRRSDLVVDLWERVLRSNSQKLGDERKYLTTYQLLI